MKIFEVESEFTTQRFYAGKTEAMKHARQCAAESGEPVSVYACTLIPGKVGIVALANGPGWQQSSEIVYTAKPRKRSKELIWSVTERTHVCHDGTNFPVNSEGYCDRCGVNVDEAEDIEGLM